MRYSMFVGVDISAKEAHVMSISADGEISEAFIIEQTPAGMAELEQRLLASGHTPADVLVVMEATGAYWMKLATYLYEAGFAISVINPAQAHHFAKALLNRSKTDAIDARILAQLAAKLQPKPWKPASATYEQLYQRLAQRDAVLEMLQQERNRRHALRLRPTVVVQVEAKIETHIAFLQSQLDDLDREIKDAIAQDHAWDEAAGLLRSIKGFGPIATAWLLTATHNFTACERPEQIASYAGLVPRLFESGSSISRRSAIGYAPHARLREALYMATLSAVQHNPAIKAFYHRLLDNGKTKKAALCACARKLVHIAWAVVTKQVIWQPDFVPFDVPVLT